MPKLDAFQVYNLLPKTNCGLCGDSTCLAFAVKLISREQTLDRCVPLFEGETFKVQRENLNTLIAPVGDALATGIVLDSEKCNGCGNCVVVCPPNIRINPGSSHGDGPQNLEGSIFVVVDGVAKIANIESCRRYEPPITQCNVCETFCPTNAIRITR